MSTGMGSGNTENLRKRKRPLDADKENGDEDRKSQVRNFSKRIKKTPEAFHPVLQVSEDLGKFGFAQALDGNNMLKDSRASNGQVEENRRVLQESDVLNRQRNYHNPDASN